MSIHAFICTRSEDKSKTFSNLLSYLGRADIKPHILVAKDSIFEAYEEELATIESDKDIVIMCHDDIEILSDPKTLRRTLHNELNLNLRVGMVGVAGAKVLKRNGVWWDTDSRKDGLLAGTVFHGNSRKNMIPSYFGPFGSVVVMDGLFQAARAGTLREIGMKKPEYFTGLWDFYDIHYSLSIYEAGYINKIVPILIRHESVGELAGRASWHANREALIKNYRLPIQCI